MPAEVIDDSNSVVDVTGAGAGHDVFLQRRFPTVPNLPLPQQMPSSEHHRQDGPPQKRDGLTDELVHSDRRPDRRGQPQQPRRDTQPPSRPRGEQCGRTCEKGETGDGSRQFSQPIDRCTHWCLLNLRPSCQRNLRAARDQPPRRATHLVPLADPITGARLGGSTDRRTTLRVLSAGSCSRRPSAGGILSDGNAVTGDISVHRPEGDHASDLTFSTSGRA